MSSESDLRRLREQAALSVFDSSPAILVAEQNETSDEKETVPLEEGTITPPKQKLRVDAPGHSEWELLSPSHMSQCGSSPRSVTLADSTAGLSRADSGLSKDSSGSLPALDIPPSAFPDSESSVEANTELEPLIKEPVVEAEMELGAKQEMLSDEGDVNEGQPIEVQTTAEAVLPVATFEEQPTEAPADEEAMAIEELPKAEAVIAEAEATEHDGQEPELAALDVLSNAPSSGHLLSGQSSYAHVSHPSRTGSAHSNEHEDDRSSHTSEWGSDNEDGHPQSEPDTEDALHELEGLSQQGSLDSDAGSTASDLDYLGSPDIGVCSVVTGFPMGSPFERAPSSQGPHAPPSSLAADLASLGVFSAASGPPSLTTATSAYSSDDETQQDAMDTGAGTEDAGEPVGVPTHEEQWRRWADCVGKTGIARILRRLGAMMKTCMERVGEAIPPKVCARVRSLLQRLDAALPEGAKSYTALLGTGLAVLSVLVAWMFAKNRYLAHNLRAREDELQRQIIKILDLQAKLQGSRTIPITRHCSLTISSAFS